MTSPVASAEAENIAMQFAFRLRFLQSCKQRGDCVTRIRLIPAGFLSFILMLPGMAAGQRGPTREVRASGPSLMARFGRDGRYSVSFAAAGWKLEGQLPGGAQKVLSTAGTDRIGSYQELTAVWDEGSRKAEIRVYRDEPVALLRDLWTKIGANREPFPSFGSLPKGAFRFSYQKEAFGPYEFGKLGAEGPWTFFDNGRHTLIVSPADHFLISAMDDDANGQAESRIVQTIASLPAGFTHATLIAAGSGINHVFAAWGAALLKLGGKQPPANNSDVTLAKLGYWTDNKTTYYYKFDKKLGYTGTLLAVRDEFRRLHIPLGYMQLDSWFYPKGAADNWDNGSGEYVYRADKTLFPQGLSAFQQKLGLPLVTHSRWVSRESPYHREYSMSGNVVVDPRFWKATAKYLHHAGVVTYEQDWLNENAQTATNLHDPSAFLGEMAAAMGRRGLSIQYCMPLPSDYMASTLYGPVETIRTSDDGFRRARWDEFLYDSRLASAVGLWPWTDAFFSRNLGDMIVSTLSGGPVGIGDAIGETNKSNVMSAIRADGVIVKPDTPLLPVDESYLRDAEGKQAAMVAAARTQFGSAEAVYLFAYPRQQAESEITVPMAWLGLQGPTYAWNWVTHRGELIPAGGSVRMEFAHGWAYEVLTPVGQDGLALLGDTNEIASLGRARISRLSNRGDLTATIAFAPQEETAEMAGYAKTRPKVTAGTGRVKLTRYDGRTHEFVLRVWPGANLDAKVEVRERP